MTPLPDGFHAAYVTDEYQPDRVRWTLHDHGGAVATGTEADQGAAYAAVRGAVAGFNGGVLLGPSGSGTDTASALAELARVYPVLRYFTWDHLPAGPLQSVSRQYARLALRTARQHPHGHPETTEALRELLKAKDAAVRAELPAPTFETADSR